MEKKWMILGTLVVSLLLAETALAAPNAHSIVRWVIGGGGGSGAAGTISLSGTIGQWAGSSGTSGATQLGSGFWGGGGAAGEDLYQFFLPLILCQHP